jgi:hypothetical protein
MRHVPFHWSLVVCLSRFQVGNHGDRTDKEYRDAAEQKCRALRILVPIRDERKQAKHQKDPGQDEEDD